MEHPNTDTLDAYAERRLNADEMTAVILHLNGCGDCFARVRSIYSVTDGADIASEELAFHLDFEEHLQPYVDNEADAVVCELVESHTQDCGECSFQLRELREFSESLRLKEIERSIVGRHTIYNRILRAWRSLPSQRSLQLIVPLIFLVFAVAASLFVIREQRSNELATTSVPNESNTDGSNLRLNGNTTNETTTTVERVVQPPLVAPHPIRNDNGGRTLPFDGNSSTDRQEVIPSEVKTAVRTGRLSLPAFITDLKGIGIVRGDSGAAPAKISPSGEVVKSLSPTISWNGSDGKEFVVSIYDENDDPYESSGVVKGDSWRPQKRLIGGKTYSWELKTQNAGGQSNVVVGRFRTLDENGLSEILKFASLSHFSRGILYANRGLITEATKEFRIAISRNDNRVRAKRFLKQLESRE